VHGLRIVLRHLSRGVRDGDQMATVTTDPVPAEYADTAQQAADECPVEAIIVERD